LFSQEEPTMSFDVTDSTGIGLDPIGDSEERAQLRAVVRRMVGEISPPERIRELDESETFDDELHRTLADLAVFSLGAPEEHGGMGDVRDQLVVIEELAAGPTSMAVFIIVHYMAIQLLSDFGDADRHTDVLQRLVAGQQKVSFALSEPGGGTDVARAMRTTASAVDGGWRIDGQKMWISGAARADHLIVLARTTAAENGSIDGISMFLVPTTARGLHISELDTVGVHGLDTCEVTLDGVEVAADALVGAQDQGFRQMLATLNRERLNTAAGSVGVGRAALGFARDYALERQAFDKPIGSFQVLQHRLVDGAMALEAARGLMVRAAEIEAGGGRADLLASMAKVAASEAGVTITQDGMQLMGGFGFSREFPMQRWFRDVRLWTFSPLTNEMVRNYLGERLLDLPRSF
jgi:alkylation response protein AidB-like acyl-CoA dehydrogenase